MTKLVRYAVIPALASLLAWSFGPTTLAVDRSAEDQPKRINGLGLARQAAGQGRVTVLLSTRQGQARAVGRTVGKLGGKVTAMLAESDFLVAQVSGGALQELEGSPAVRALALDQAVTLDRSAMQPLAEQAVTTPSESDPGLSLRIARGEIRAPQFTSLTGNDGTGAVIAVLDTGVDPAHPALLKTPDGAVKITDWQDFTGEGDVATAQARTELIPSITTQSGSYRVGQFKESQIPKGEMSGDINRNGSSDDTFAVLVTDAAKKGVYDTTYIDTNLNGDFTDEKPMRVYNHSFDVGRFGPKESGVSFVVSRVNPDGSGINLGYDGGLHGTHVAGIAAGSGPVTGVAPGARVMAIKVLTSGGTGSWSGIIQGMNYAAAHGAHVINMSLGGLSELNDGADPQSRLIEELSAKHDVLFSIAAGNSGPGLNSMALPGVSGAAVTSGAFISSNTWKADYGLNVPQDGLWYFSSAGPRDDGGLKPNVVAPGTANSAIPTWAGQYAVFQGTSMAAPQTAGAAALLAGAAKAQGLQVRPKHLKMALETSARRLSGYGWYEQGHGLIQVDAAWEKLGQVARETAPDLVSYGKAKPGINATGFYARDFAFTRQDSKWVVGSRNLKGSDLALTYLHGSGLTVSGPSQVRVAPLQRQAIPLKYQHADAPGVYDALIQARAPGQASYAAEYLATVVVPHEFDPAKGNLVRGIAGSLGPARYGRHFVRVPEGTAELKIDLRVPGGQGRVRLMAYTPDGMPAGESDWAGTPRGPEGQTLTIANPQPGVWEIDASASHGAMNHGLATNKYVIDVAARGVYATPDKVTLPAAFGQSQTREIALANYYGDLKAVTAGVGFVQPRTERGEVEHGGFKDLFFEVTEGTTLVRSGFSQVLDPNADLSIRLYYNDPKAGWTPVGRVSGHRLISQVELRNPKPGQYAAEIVGNRVPTGKTSFMYSLAEVKGGEQIQVKEALTDRAFGTRWSVPVTFKVPGSPGQYLGAVTVRDEATGQVLTVVPVDIR